MFRSVRPAFFVVLSAIFAQSACGPLGVGKPTEHVRVLTAPGWAAGASGEEARVSSGWLEDWGDARLTAVVNEALAHQPALKATAARVWAAAEEARVAGAARRPGARLAGSSGWEERRGGGGRADFGAQFSVSWEADLWGRLRRLEEAAWADSVAAQAEYRGARLSLVANTARAWCNLISAGQELELAEVTLDSFEKNLRIIERNYRSTGEGALDLRFGRTNVASARRTVEARKFDQGEAARALQVWLGRYPDGKWLAPAELPRLRDEIPAGLPADLLERRPDLTAARARLLASAQRTEALRVAWLPDLALTGSGGAVSTQFAELLDIDRLVSVVAARVTQLVADGGAAEARAKAALARNQAEVQAYCQLALEAFREVETALAAEQALRKQEAFLMEEESQAALGERQAERDYAEGVNPNILSVLEAQRRANNARAALIRLRNQRLINRIQLHLALGGDFRKAG